MAKGNQWTVGGIAITVISAQAAFAQASLTQAGAPMEFEVATVKTSPPPPEIDRININLGNFRNGKLTFGNASLSDCLKYAYGVVSDAQLAGPDWIKSKSVRFDIVAQAPPDTPRPQLELMLQRLLADRLKVALHHEQRELPYVALVVGKGGPKMREVQPDRAGPQNGAFRGRIAGNQVSMQLLATLLSRSERETVIDLTGLKGVFEMKLEWTPDDGRPVVINGVAIDAPSLFTAVQEQLGLKLESRKGPLDVLVVDHAEMAPAEN
jgi:uncharacterized protein (TIGR03435 family)